MGISSWKLFLPDSYRSMAQQSGVSKSVVAVAVMKVSRPPPSAPFLSGENLHYRGHLCFVQVEQHAQLYWDVKMTYFPSYCSVAKASA